MSVYRLTPLPEGKIRGRLIVPVDVAERTGAALQRSRGVDGPHEGIVYWCGRRIGAEALVMSAFVPRSDHGAQRVMVSERDVGRMSRCARKFGVSIVAQVHSHPGDDTRHSDGDDTLVLMPFEDMFSLVVGRYGEGSILPREGAGLHQYQDGRWVRITVGDEDPLLLVPAITWVEP